MMETVTPFDWLVESSRRDPKRTRLTFLDDFGGVETLSGRELIARCESLADDLRGVADPGDRILLAYPAGLDFVVGFLACVRADLIPVPISYPKPRRTLSRYQTIVDDCDAKLALTVQKTLDVIDPSTLSGVTFVTETTVGDAKFDSGLAAFSHDLELPPPGNRERILFLQYTSGSTSHPKGVCVTYGNLIANLRAISDGYQIEQIPISERVVVSWLPAYHDMGLVGIILASLVHDAHAVLMSPTGFLQKPAKWLQAITDFGARVTVAPCFGYRWAANKIDPREESLFDLSHLAIAGCGAEPIDPQVLRDFSDRFGRYHFDHRAFYPCYGLAESTLMVSGTDRTLRFHGEIVGPVTCSISRRQLRDGKVVPPSDERDCVEVVSSGVMATATMVKIIDPETHCTCPDDRVGEIYVHSQSVAAGYWNRPDATKTTFQVKLADDPSFYLRTGDLGFIRVGQLYVTGRLKDVLIVRGQNHYPEDIERTVQQASDFLAEGRGTVFMSEPPEERLVVLHEVARNFQHQQAETLVRKIRLAIAAEHDLAVDEICLLRTHSMPRTSSGKVQRFRSRELYESNEIKYVATWQHHETLDPSLFPDIQPLLRREDARGAIQHQIETTLLGWLARERGLSPDLIDTTTSFAEFGIDSLMAVELSRQMEGWLGQPLSPVLAWSYPNIGKLSQHLASVVMPEVHGHNDDDEENLLEDLLDEVEGLDDDEVQAELSRYEA